MEDSNRMGLDPMKRARRDADQRHRFFRFDPTVSSGTLLQLLVLALGAGGAYATYRSDQTQTRADIDQIKMVAERDRNDLKTAVDVFRTDMREVKGSLESMGKDVAVVKAQTVTANRNVKQ